MYVCLCNKVTDKQIIRAHKKGATTVDHLTEQLNLASTCGSCIEHAQEILDECTEMQKMLESTPVNYSLATNAA